LRLSEQHSLTGVLLQGVTAVDLLRHITRSARYLGEEAVHTVPSRHAEVVLRRLGMDKHDVHVSGDPRGQAINC
jgi:hypothetical protein